MLPAKQIVVSAGVSKTSYAEVVELCDRWASESARGGSGAARYICVTSVHGLVLARDDASFAEVLNSADIVTPDGMPVVWALRSLGARSQQRVYGPTLMLELCRRAAERGHRIYLYGGGAADLLTLLEARLCRQFPGLRIAGRHAPPFRPLTPEEDRRIAEAIRSSGAALVFVGIGTPKQERWMFEHRHAFPGVTLIGVGAAFDIHAGRTAQAPSWMQRLGLEWFFRLSTEPRRLAKRYLIVTPRFLPLWLVQCLKTVRESRA